MRKIIKKLVYYFYTTPIIFTIIVSFFISLLSSVFMNTKYYYTIKDILQGSIIYLPLTLSITLTFENLIFFILNPKFDNNSYAHKKIEVLGLCLGLLFNISIFTFLGIRFSDWNIQLSNSEVHSPILISSTPTIIVILLISLLGYIYCRFVDLKNQPPLITVVGISSMYLGLIISIMWCIQIWNYSFLLLLLPFNYIIIILKTVRYLIYQKSQIIEPNVNPDNNSPDKLSNLNKIISTSSNWPWLGIVVMLPLLGIIISILILFGQKPDSIIKAWTETADWTFSQKVPPQNIYYDEHYLCTVAAGGHKEIVKPIREGKRHGHKVLVNRQLCIANAFEQILEEKTPKIHKIIRSIYDKYGYPIATKIKSPYIADIIYFLMKPLEWIFLIVLYTVDTKPENRISIQYPHTAIPKL